MSETTLPSNTQDPISSVLDFISELEIVQILSLGPGLYFLAMLLAFLLILLSLAFKPTAQLVSLIRFFTISAILLALMPLVENGIYSLRDDLKPITVKIMYDSDDVFKAEEPLLLKTEDKNHNLIDDSYERKIYTGNFSYRININKYLSKINNTKFSLNEREKLIDKMQSFICGKNLEFKDISCVRNGAWSGQTDGES